MADLALSAAQTLFAALECRVLREVCSVWDYKSQLEDLKETVSTIRKVLLDAEAQRELSHEANDYLDKLKDAVYDADDLFDEVLTLAELKLRDKGNTGISEKMRAFFSSNKNPLSAAYTTSKEVKKIKKKLEGIANDHSKFGFKFDSRPTRVRRDETCSYVYAPYVVGREGDKKAVIDRLLDSQCKENVCCLSIVGVGGLGKTTLAQLVYHYDRVKREFSLKLWVCVSDQDGENFDVKVILYKILDSAGHKADNGSTKEWVQSQFQKNLGGKKCFIVLDDVWNENPYEWGKLKSFLMGLGMGSKIVASTRSRECARIIGGGGAHTYELKGLSKENSWDLFEMVAFGERREHVNTLELVEIGKEIVEQCSNVPLAIKVVGSLLFGLDKSKWQAFEKTRVTNVSLEGNDIMSILKLSYDYLETQLKSCFSYCAVFPKDFEIEKDMLVSLWMAQGYIRPFYEGQSMEAAGEEHFLVLLRRCFFQNVRMDKFGGVVSCKIHNLMHDVAQNVAAKEIAWVSTIRTNLGGKKVRHLFEDRWDNCTMDYGPKRKIRSYLQDSRYGSHGTIALDELGKDWVCLRALSLDNHTETFPESIGNLFRLRYLDLHGCGYLEALPKSVTKLLNLQTLLLAGCGHLKELPKDLRKLVNLRHLDIRGCDELTYMPSGMDTLSCLAMLSNFHVAVDSSIPPVGRLKDLKAVRNSVEMQSVGQLKDLKALKNLKGHISISIPGNYTCVGEREQEGGYLASMEHLRSVNISFETLIYPLSQCQNEESVVNHEGVLEKLQPHPNLRGLELRDFRGRSLPRWGGAQDNWANILPNLVEIKLSDLNNLHHVPLLSELEHLRSLILDRLENVEYIEEDTPSSSRTRALVPFFPSLEYLRLDRLIKLKRCWRRRGAAINDASTSSDRCWQPPAFPSLSKLIIRECRDLVSFPSCPSVETLRIEALNKRLRIMDLNLKVNEVNICTAADLKALPLCYPAAVRISHSYADTFLGAGEEVFKTLGFSCLPSLTIECCDKLKIPSGHGFRHLTALESLEISNCRDLILDDNNDGIPWRSLHHSLRSLHLRSLYKLENLRSLYKGMQRLTSLQHLNIEYCFELQGLPEWISCLSALQTLVIMCCGKIKSIPEAMRNLTSLRQLEIRRCSDELKERCRDPDGEDWLKIQHIPYITIECWGYW